jgi:hypothetical protein
MGQDEMKLPSFDEQAFSTAKVFHKEWIIDPIFLHRIKLDTLVEMEKLRFQYLADAARMDASLRIKEAELLEKFGKMKY